MKTMTPILWIGLLMVACPSIVLADDDEHCFPACRSGYVCHPTRHECVELCNPPCGEGKVCTKAGKCIELATVPAAPKAKLTTGDSASYVAPKDKALVVFLRRTGIGFGRYHIIDQNKRLLTVLRGNQHVMVEAEPGKYTFYLLAENTDQVRAELAAGRTYVIDALVTTGFGKATVRAEPVLRGSKAWSRVSKWIRRSTKPGTPDLKKGAEWMADRESMVSEKVAKADRDWSARDEKWRAVRTMRAEDGRTPDEAGEL